MSSLILSDLDDEKEMQALTHLKELSPEEYKDLLDPETVRGLYQETLARLLKAAAKVSGIDKHGSTPLHVAARSDNIMAAEILLREGAKVMPKDTNGKTPLDYAESARMIKLLKQNGATER